MVDKLSSVLCMCLWHRPTMASSRLLSPHRWYSDRSLETCSYLCRETSIVSGIKHSAVSGRCEELQGLCLCLRLVLCSQEEMCWFSLLGQNIQFRFFNCVKGKSLSHGCRGVSSWSLVYYFWAQQYSKASWLKDREQQHHSSHGGQEVEKKGYKWCRLFTFISHDLLPLASPYFS